MHAFRHRAAPGVLLGVFLALAALLLRPVSSAGETRYPLFAIGHIPPSAVLSESEILYLASHFHLMHGPADAAVLDLLRAADPRHLHLLYLDSVQSEYGNWRQAESALRQAVAMHRAGTLADDVGPSEASLAVTSEGPAPAFKPSTVAPGEELSEDAFRYVTWLRIDEELCKIAVVSGETLQVERGLGGTSPGPHRRGAPVLSPIYEGSGGVPAWAGYPDNPNGRLRYVLDIARDDVRNYLADEVIERLDTGYDGAWLDLMGVDFWNYGDAFGRRVVPWNFAAGAPYTSETYAGVQAGKVEAIRMAVQAARGVVPVLVGNSLGGARYFPDGPERIVVASLDAMNIENFASVAREDVWYPLRVWSRQVNLLLDALSRGIPMLAMSGPAGVRIVDVEEWTPARARHERFNFATFLLAYLPGSRIAFGVPAFRRDGSDRYPWVHAQYGWDLGEPIDTATTVTELQVPGSASYWRHFTRGLVVVNPSESDDPPLDLGGLYRDPESGETMSSLTPLANTGYILIEEAPVGPVGPEGPVPPPDGGLLLGPSFPNPFNPSVTIPYHLPGARGTVSPVRVVVFDLRGRLVRSLVEAVQAPGLHAIVWDGRTAAGVRAPSAPYLVRLEVGGEQRTARIVLLR